MVDDTAAARLGSALPTLLFHIFLFPFPSPNTGGGLCAKQKRPRLSGQRACDRADQRTRRQVDGVTTHQLNPTPGRKEGRTEAGQRRGEGRGERGGRRHAASRPSLRRLSKPTCMQCSKRTKIAGGVVPRPPRISPNWEQGLLTCDRSLRRRGKHNTTWAPNLWLWRPSWRFFPGFPPRHPRKP